MTTPNARSRPHTFTLLAASALAVSAYAYVVVAQPGGQPSPTTAEPARATRVDAPLVTEVTGVGRTVGDLSTSVAFYRDVLGFRVLSEREEVGEGVEHLTGVFGARRRTAVMQLGGEVLELSDYLAPEGRAIPLDSRSNDAWFQHIAIVVRDMDEAYAHLRARNVKHASSGPQTLPDWNKNAGGIRAFYFKDPDGHPVEIIWFPEGKGDPRWKALASAMNAPLFLGIDHTAIVVKDTAASLAFYQDALGMRVAGESENFGTEQEHLNNVFGARLRITGLRAHSGMGVEFLEYRSPTTGHNAPADAASNDLWHDHTIFSTPASDAGQSRLTGPTARWVSPGAVDPDGAGPQPEQLLVLDPDAHAVLLRTHAATPASGSGNQQAAAQER